MRLLVVSQSLLFREGVKKYLTKVVGDCLITESASLFGVNLQSAPDFIFLEDGAMPCEGDYHDVKLVVFFNPSNPPKNIRFSYLNIVGLIPKNHSAVCVEQALNLILSGSSYAPVSLLKTRQEPTPANPPPLKNGQKQGHLTERQMEVLRLLSVGMSNKAIAYQMNVSEATVKLHVNALMKNFQAHNRTQTVVSAQKSGIIF